VDEPRVELRQRTVAELEPPEGALPEVLDEHVGTGQEATEDIHARRVA